jgi:hypothetical protein
MENKDKLKQNKTCCTVHPMYDTLLCAKAEGHEGLHSGYFQFETLRWGIPTHQQLYDVVRTK